MGLRSHHTDSLGEISDVDRVFMRIPVESSNQVLLSCHRSRFSSALKETADDKTKTLGHPITLGVRAFSGEVGTGSPQKNATT
jgi:hypothetical protein